MADFGLLAGSGWAAGLNLWSVGLVLGIAGRFDLAQTPDVLQRGWVLLILALLYVLEFFVDKIPLLDSAWDVISTIIRPVGAALLGLAIASDGDTSMIAGAATAGGLALTSHAAKATMRAAINMSPEPFTNWIASVTEDATAIGLSSVALASPALAGGLALVLAVIAVLIAVTMWRFVQRVRQLVVGRVSRRSTGAS